MTIEIIVTVQWSKFNWDMSFENVVALESLLPLEGRVYDLPFSENQRPLVDGKAYIIWRPPHSELNGWWDKRPTEILKSYVVEGEVETDAEQNKQFKFTVVECKKLSDMLHLCRNDQELPCAFMPSKINWQTADELKYANLGELHYLCGRDGETWLELIFSRNDLSISVHYAAYLPEPSYHDVILGTFLLSDLDEAIVYAALEKAEIIEDTSFIEIPEDKVFGAEYW